jgi:superfamily II DNA or RNA helicase
VVTQTVQPEAAHADVEIGGSARRLIGQARALREAIAWAVAAPGVTGQAARAAHDSIQANIARRELETMPLDTIKDITGGRVRLGAIENAGYRTVGAVLAAPPHLLDAIPGVGPQTVAQVSAAARQLLHALAQQTRVRIDPDTRTQQQTALLAALREYEIARSLVPPRGPDLVPLAADLDRHLSAAGNAGSKLRMFFTGARKKQDARDALSQLAAITVHPFAIDASQRIAQARRALVTAAPEPLQSPRSRRPQPPRAPQAPQGPIRSWNIRQPAPASRRAPGHAELWDDYLARPVEYNGLLIEVAGLAPDREASQGFLPAELAERIHQFPLDLSLMTASLRGYQAFGAKFSLVQRKVIIGDEMGLGKTIQALAAMCHLTAASNHTAANGTASDGSAANGSPAQHFLVVCPASVLVNWTREVAKHTRLTPFKLHGDDRERSEQAWIREGGVAVTTYEALRSMRQRRDVPVGLLVVDEAHYAKNPEALRTKAVSAWARASQRVLFLTGTPMENRVDEFRVLVGHLRPDVATAVRDVDGALGGTAFRKAVAPVYLRRNQDDVLSELPERLETQEWVELDGPALAAYQEAVFAGNFMAMRRAAFAPGTIDGSAKLKRLAELVGEATEDGRKVVVFSFFRDVLDTVARTLSSIAIGPLTGDVPPPARQAMVDQFTTQNGPAVLVSQIQAGGVGLNIQAASVVIITEPQMTPAAEDQAIARAHRMGQVRRVDVHRLLAEDSVDARMLDLLHGKRVAFDEYARRSDLAESTPDAIGVSDLSATKEAASQAEAQRRIVEMEQRRLHAAAEPRELA